MRLRISRTPRLRWTNSEIKRGRDGGGTRFNKRGNLRRFPPRSVNNFMYRKRGGETSERATTIEREIGNGEIQAESRLEKEGILGNLSVPTNLASVGSVVPSFRLFRNKQDHPPRLINFKRYGLIEY